MSDRPVLSHARLDVYQCAIKFLAFAMRLIAAMPKGNAEVKDQLKRAALSIVLNIAEGAGRTSAGEQRRHSAIARGSALESSAVLDASEIMGLAPAPAVVEGNELLARIVAMLTKMTR